MAAHVGLEVYMGRPAGGMDRFEYVTVERAAVREVRDCLSGPGTPRPEHATDYFATVVTAHASYVVRGARGAVAARIWPPPAACATCRRPL
jgi:hypothetical protein